jgi:hypothetical protein
MLPGIGQAAPMAFKVATPTQAALNKQKPQSQVICVIFFMFIDVWLCFFTYFCMLFITL